MKTNLLIIAALTFSINAFAANVPEKDAEFAKQTAMGGMLEVKLGELAEKQAQSSKVKDFGRMMASDHSKAGDKLKSIAKSQNLELPTSLDEKHQKIVDKFSKLQGAEFDKEYVSLMVDDHEKVLSQFKEEASSGKDTELKGFATDGTPMIQHHLDEAKALKKELK